MTTTAPGTLPSGAMGGEAAGWAYDVRWPCPDRLDARRAAA